VRSKSDITSEAARIVGNVAAAVVGQPFDSNRRAVDPGSSDVIGAAVVAGRIAAVEIPDEPSENSAASELGRNVAQSWAARPSVKKA
jgi:hypothetical protein